MAPSFASSWRSFWHTMTSYDRHASHDSPYRTGQHVPLAQSRHAPLTSIATSALESRHDLSYAHDSIEDSSTFVNGQTNGRMSPQSPAYKPGMRTSLQRVSTDNSAAEIQMQNFSDGLPPAPPVSHSWKRIDRWAEDTYTELYDNLSDPCTQNDVNELEHELDCTLPLDVRESLQIHDGQERGGLPTGIIFGCMLLDCEEMVQEWQNWRRVGDEYLSPTSSARNSTSAAAHANGLSSPVSATTPALPLKAFAGISATASSSSAPTVPVAPSSPTNPQWRSDLLSRQTCHPPNTIQHAYTHPAWIPLARDWGGNCIAVDLAPGPAGKWGQVIMFGRDYDCKFVVGRSWAHFLAAVADDFGAGDFKLDDAEGRDGKGNGGKVFVDEETGELRFREFWERQPGVDVPYLEVLRWRCERKYGRRPMQKRPSIPGGANGKTGLRINPNAGPPTAQRSFSGQHDSPYGSPTASVSSEQERGRSPSRFSQGAPGKQPLVSSPLARVAEEPGGPGAARKQPISVRTDLPAKAVRGSNADKLVSVDSPRPSGDFPLARVTSFGSIKAESPLLLKENNKRSSDGETAAAAPPRLGVDGLLATPVANKPPFEIGEGNDGAEKKDSPQSKEGEMKNVEI